MREQVQDRGSARENRHAGARHELHRLARIEVIAAQQIGILEQAPVQLDHQPRIRMLECEILVARHPRPHRRRARIGRRRDPHIAPRVEQAGGVRDLVLGDDQIDVHAVADTIAAKGEHRRSRALQHPDGNAGPLQRAYQV